MSYCRRGYASLGPEYASDVYVYACVSGSWICDDCPRLGHHTEPTPFCMAAHLVDDRLAGFTVQQDVIDTLVYDSENGTLQGCRRPAEAAP